MASRSGAAAEPLIAPLSLVIQWQLDAQRLFVSALVAKHFPGSKLSGSRGDFRLLQRILDAKLIPRTNTWELQALGVVFGDALIASARDLAWWEVTDEYGTDPTIRFRTTSVQLNVLTALAKRVERGEIIEVEALAERMVRFIETEALKYR
jgi:hypothetical protein